MKKRIHQKHSPTACNYTVVSLQQVLHSLAYQAIVAFDITTISGPSSYIGTPNTLQRREIILDTGCGTGKGCKFHVVWQYMYTLTTLLMVLYKIYKIYKIYIKKI